MNGMPFLDDNCEKKLRNNQLYAKFHMSLVRLAFGLHLAQ